MSTQQERFTPSEPMDPEDFDGFRDIADYAAAPFRHSSSWFLVIYIVLFGSLTLVLSAILPETKDPNGLKSVIVGLLSLVFVLGSTYALVKFLKLPAKLTAAGEPASLEFTGWLRDNYDAKLSPGGYRASGEYSVDNHGRNKEQIVQLAQAFPQGKGSHRLMINFPDGRVECDLNMVEGGYVLVRRDGAR